MQKKEIQMQQHDFKVTKKTMMLAGRELSIETGKMAKQANGSALITYGKTTMLATAVMGKLSGVETDFFPLTVDYIEKMFASGKIPGGFFKRETKPSTEATLIARLIDRTIRPLFPEGFRNPVHVCITPLTYDGENHPEDIGILAASIALTISDIPFHGPVSGVTVGIIDEQIVVNPTIEQMKNSKLELLMNRLSLIQQSNK
jgi:polyribonucleotide nucleotidyltransferase